MKKALITGITGQDGYFLTKLLLEKGYEVHGLARRNSQMTLGTMQHLSSEERSKIKFHWGDLLDSPFITQLIRVYLFDEVYHLGAQSFVGLSFHNPHATYDVNISGTMNLVNAIKEHSQRTRVYFAATSELYGKAQAVPQNEQTPFHPRSPYGVSKLAAFWTMKNYREAYGLFLTNGILFNHESEHRGPEFVTRKIAMAAARIAKGDAQPMRIGFMDAKRDWGFAGDYVEGMWRMLQQPEPDDFVLATGQTWTVREFAERGFLRAGIPVRWEGEGQNEIGLHAQTGVRVIEVDPVYFRPSEVDLLVGDFAKAQKILGWSPTLSFEGLVERMVDADVQRLA